MASNAEHAKLILEALSTKTFSTDRMEEILEAEAGLYGSGVPLEKLDGEARAAIFVNRLRSLIVGDVVQFSRARASFEAGEQAATDAKARFGDDVIGEPIPVTPKPGDIGPIKPGGIAEPIGGKG